MTPLITTTLVAHIIIGLFGIATLHFAYMQLIRKTPPYRLIEWVSWSSLFFFLASWATGAYYYVTYYGGAVKPRIVSGAYPWAHQVFMEAKEHVFILIPFLVCAFALSIHSLRKGENPNLKRAAAFMAVTALALGIFVAGSGILVSGAVR